MHYEQEYTAPTQLTKAAITGLLDIEILKHPSLHHIQGLEHRIASPAYLHIGIDTHEDKPSTRVSSRNGK